MKRAVFLDRDGVINRAFVREGRPYPPATLEVLEILPGVAESLNALKAAGYLLIVVTNQPDVARGTMSLATVEAIHAHLTEQLPLDGVYCCYHDDRDRCECRKPLPGLFRQAAREHRIDLARSFMIGDRWKDIAAGQNAGCRCVWINCNHSEPRPDSPPDYVATSLVDASAWILQTS